MKKIPLVFSLAFLAGACAVPPTQQIADAQSAVTAAVQAGAGDYAADSLRAAQDALAAANTLVDAKQYKEAKASAVDAKAKAEAAQAAVGPAKEQAKTETEAKIAAVRKGVEASAMNAAKAKGKSAHMAKEESAMIGRAFNEAQSDFSAGNYKSAMDKLANVETRLKEVKTKAPEPAKAPAKKKHK